MTPAIAPEMPSNLEEDSFAAWWYIQECSGTQWVVRRWEDRRYAICLDCDFSMRVVMAVYEIGGGLLAPGVICPRCRALKIHGTHPLMAWGRVLKPDELLTYDHVFDNPHVSSALAVNLERRAMQPFPANHDSKRRKVTQNI